MASRSRRGCIDCKKAKVKCDEVHPGCGTCYRRGYICQGYLGTDTNSSSMVPNLTPSITNLTLSTSLDIRTSPVFSIAKRAEPLTDDTVESALAPSAFGCENCTSNHRKSHAQPNTSTDEDERPDQAILYLNSISRLPPGTISSHDGSVIEIYFTRHSSNLVISAEFVEEMNSNILKVFYHDPQAVCDPLSAIGHIYMDHTSESWIVPVLNRKARILKRLRTMSGISDDLEKTIVLLLGLCALELLDEKSLPKDNLLPALIANTAFSINHYVSEGKVITSVAKYFIRAIARQDIIISLTYSRRSLVAIDAWLDDECAKQPDRFMGYTGTMMPLLAELTALAEDIRHDSSVGKGLTDNLTTPNSLGSDLVSFPSEHNFQQRGAKLCSKIKEWRPMSNPRFSFESCKIFLFHARSFQSAALLYLHRLFHPPGSSVLADDTAISMAYDVLMYISGTPAELKLSLWPVFIAATELLSEENRSTALQIYEMIYSQRGTVTTQRTKQFTVDRVWKARDAGLDWNWMALAYQYPGECMPI